METMNARYGTFRQTLYSGGNAARCLAAARLCDRLTMALDGGIFDRDSDGWRRFLRGDDSALPGVTPKYTRYAREVEKTVRYEYDGIVRDSRDAAELESRLPGLIDTLEYILGPYATDLEDTAANLAGRLRAKHLQLVN